MKKQRLELAAGSRMFTVLLNREIRSRVTILSRGIVVHLHRICAETWYII